MAEAPEATLRGSANIRTHSELLKTLRDMRTLLDEVEDRLTALEELKGVNPS